MCKSIAAGGQRCAAHTRNAYHRAVARSADNHVIDTAAAEYASTTEGAGHFTKLIQDGEMVLQDPAVAELVVRWEGYVRRGHSIRAANREAASLIKKALSDANAPLRR